MATSIIREDGTGDYTSLAAWEAGEQRDLVAAGDGERAEIQGTWTIPETAPLTVDGWTTNAQYYIEIEAVGAARHAGVWSDTAYRLDVTLSAGMRAMHVLEQFTRLAGFQVRATASGQDGSFGYQGIEGARIFVDSLIVVGDFSTWVAGSTVCRGIFLGVDVGGDQHVRNTIVYGFQYPSAANGAGIRMLNHTSGATYVENCTVVRCGIGVLDGYNDVRCRNVVAFDCASTGFSAGTGPSQNNASSDASAPGAGSLTGIADPFVDSSNDDYHLAPGSALIDAGVDLSGAFTTDIDGEPRSGAWDIGADQYVAVGGGSAMLPALIMASAALGAATVVAKPAQVTPAPTLGAAIAFAPQAVPAIIVSTPSIQHDAVAEGVVVVGAAAIGLAAVESPATVPMLIVVATPHAVEPPTLNNFGQMLAATISEGSVGVVVRPSALFVAPAPAPPVLSPGAAAIRPAFFQSPTLVVVPEVVSTPLSVGMSRLEHTAGVPAFMVIGGSAAIAPSTLADVASVPGLRIVGEASAWLVSAANTFRHRGPRRAVDGISPRRHLQ